ncbi:MAG TPA: PEPxxWA-CTERM sorting domain-containing protein [Croceibacterium sp.]|nr:PEPxxWA-CTERM sorting domain-containing protein [Croceibacterium sp.]
MRKLLTAAVLTSAVAIAAPASAGQVWLDNQHSNYSGSGQTYTFTGSDGVVVRASAWSVDAGGIIRAATLGVWDQGLGVDNSSRSGADNSHTIDNTGWQDFVVLQFNKVVDLGNAQFNTGWDSYNDTDATIGFANSALPFGTNPAWNGVSDSVLNALNLYSSNAGSGLWGASGNSNRDINTAGNTGNLWLIGASFNNPDWSADGFKLEKLTFDVVTPAVPEPATWLMMILGFGLIGGMLRSQRRENLSVSYS